MSCIAISSTPHKRNSLTTNSTGTDPAGWPLWWRQQSIAAHADWQSLIDLHFSITDLLRRSS
jgi:hypothetical protein